MSFLQIILGGIISLVIAIFLTILVVRSMRTASYGGAKLFALLAALAYMACFVFLMGLLRTMNG